jgi:ubiquitin-conjugating enzyme E2 O
VKDEGTTEESVYSVYPHPKFSLFQRNTILFSNNPDLHEFNAGVVIDVDITQGNMIIYCTDNRHRKVWPHMVVPFPKRCSWNFFTRKWIVDDLIPPPQQLGIEHYPKNYELTATEVEEVLADFRTRNKRSLWEDPQFDILENAPDSHYFKTAIPFVDQNLNRIVRDEFDIIRGNVPEGVYIRVYEDRMDLISALIIGPAKTPYEDCLLMFDLKLPRSFPKSPPKVQFISYTGEIHPLISEDGNFCQANLQWKYYSDDNEVNQPKSYILEAVRSIQGLFFTREPFFADGVKNKQSPDDQEKSRAYNEAVFLQLLDAYYRTALKPHEPWKQFVADHVLRNVPKKVSLIESWISGADSTEAGTHAHSSEAAQGPPFPLLPVTKGFKLTFDARVKSLRTILANIVPPPVEQPEEEEVLAQATKGKSSSSLVNTLEEILHQQIRGTLGSPKPNPETKEDKDETGFIFADI